jgi:hypothetical protein
MCIFEARGFVVDLTGTPLAQHLVTFCGRACYGGTSDENGSFSVAVGDFVDPDGFVVHLDGSPDHADAFARIARVANGIAELASRLASPALPPGEMPLPEDGATADAEVRGGDLTLTVAAGTAFDLSFEAVAMGKKGRMLRVARAPAALGPPGALSVHALGPSGANASKPVAVRVRAAGTPGAAAEILILSDQLGPIPAVAGTWVHAAHAHVSQDGTTIASDPGEGITELTWLAARQ